MADDRDFIGTPWWTTVSGEGMQPSTGLDSWADDYTRSRSGLQYDSVEDIIGRKDYQKYRLTTNTPTTVSGEGTILI